MNPHTRKVLWFTLVGILLAALSAFLTQSWLEFLLNATAYFLHLSILDILLRNIYSPLEPRNEENINIWNWKVICLTLLIIIEIAAVQHGHNLQLVPLFTSWLLSFTALMLLKQLLELNRRRTVRELVREPEELTLDNFNGLDYGSGMAYSFFFGYLRLMLPDPGDERQGIRELIDIYVNVNQQVQFGARKLFILIPSSAHCPPSVADRSRFMTARGSLQWRRMNRAGVTARQYHHSVYSLQVNQEEIYVCVEYATPLLTLYEIMGQNTGGSRLYQRYRDRLVINFYTTLQMIINNDRDCRDLVELIYFRDVDNDGNPLNLDQLDVGNLILERLN